MLKYYRMNLHDSREHLYFEVGCIWYILTKDEKIKKAKTQDIALPGQTHE